MSWESRKGTGQVALYIKPECGGVGNRLHVRVCEVGVDEDTNEEYPRTPREFKTKHGVLYLNHELGLTFWERSGEEWRLMCSCELSYYECYAVTARECEVMGKQLRKYGKRLEAVMDAHGGVHTVDEMVAALAQAFGAEVVFIKNMQPGYQKGWSKTTVGGAREYVRRCEASLKENHNFSDVRA